jgi:ATP-dependent helicase HrpA
MRVRVHRERADSDTVHRALLAGLLSHVGTRTGERRDYLGARNARFSLSSGSALAEHPPAWVMAGELVETTKLWAHVAARIRPEWIEQVGHHLVERSYSDPHWNARRGQAVAYERVTLYGLTIVDRRPVNYARLDPGHARDLFIRHALVDGDWSGRHAFITHNRALIDEVRGLEERVRRRNLLATDEVIHEFYDARVPADVVSARHFDRWWRGARGEQPDLLDLTLELVLEPEAGNVRADDFPDVWTHDGMALRLTYEFQPGSAADGVTVHVPLPALAQLRDARLDWHIPGHRRELVAALVRTLPRQLRRKFVPVAEYADAFLARASPADGPLVEVLTRDLARVAGEPVAPSDVDRSHLPDHLQMTIRVVDEAGGTLAAGKDLPALERHLQRRIRQGISHAAASFERRSITAWDFGDLSQRREVQWSGHSFEVFPALVDDGTSVSIRTFVTEDEQARAMWQGTRRLLLLGMPSPLRSLGKRLTSRTKIALAHAPHDSYDALLDDCVHAAVDLLMASKGGPAWDEASFRSLRDAISDELPDRVFGVVAVVARILARAHEVREHLATVTTPNVVPSAADVQLQLSRLVFPGFVTATGAAKLPDLLRYIDAIDHRLDKLPGNPMRDLERTRVVQHVEEQLAALPRSPERERIRWLIEELRVSLFAQQLGTKERVSEQRVSRELERLQTTWQNS